ncbi:hypothetical protein NN3_41750 [Nocardia neocaledoniensis NBRC 108232]|nr:hypothetical protein NN3_41750 [Nocardia neocaledoniensis NBRC 108232]
MLDAFIAREAGTEVPLEMGEHTVDAVFSLVEQPLSRPIARTVADVIPVEMYCARFIPGP